MRGLLTSIILLISSIGFSQVIIENSVSDLGTIIESNGEVKTSYYLIGGRDTSEIIDVRTSCGCATVVSKEKLILPGQKIKVDATYNPEGRIGHFSKAMQIVVVTNGINQSLNLTVKGRVVSSKKDLVRNKKSINYINVKEIRLPFINEFDTSSFVLSDLHNFINTLTYVIDKDQFATIRLVVRLPDESFKSQSQVWLNRFKNKINSLLNTRGYRGYQVNYHPPEFISNDDYSVMGTATVSIPKYFKMGVKKNIVEYKYDVIDAPPLATSKSYTKKEFKKFYSSIDSALLIKKMILDTLGEFEIIGKLNQRKQLKQVSKLEKKILKKYSGKIQIKSKVQLGAKEFKLDFKEVENLPTYSRVDVEYAIKQRPIMPKSSTYFQNGKKLNVESKNFELFTTQLQKNESEIYSYSVLLNVPYTSRKEKTTIHLKELGKQKIIIRKIFDSLKIPYWNVKAHLVESKMFKEKESPTLTIVPHKRERNTPNIIKPYLVYFSSNQFHLDSTSYILNNFVKSLIKEINSSGFVDLIIESSSSKAPSRTDISTLEMSYQRRDFAEEYLRRQLKLNGIDPNRLLITSKKAFLEGPKYENDYFENKEKYKKFQYLKLIPKKSIN